LTAPVFFRIGTEFMPPLNEGTILYMPTTVPGISVGEASLLLQKQDEILKSFPEVKSVHGKAGRADTSTDPAPLSMMETVVVLKDQREWRSVDRWYSFLPDFLQFPFHLIWPNYMSWDELISEMDKKMQFPGLVNAWTMPIKGRIDMLSTGMRTPVGIKILGDDLPTIEKLGQEIETTLSKVKGTRGVFSERVAGGYFLDYEFNREALARYGFSVKYVQEVLSSAVGGRNVSTAIEGRERYPIQVRYARDFRNSIDDLNHILLQTKSGQQVPIGEVARIEMKMGPGMIRNENGLLAGYVFVDIETTDIGSYVKEAKKVIQDEIKLPSGVSLLWSGQYESILRVKEKLKVLLPITLLIIFLLIYMSTGSFIKTGIIGLSIPFAGVGAIWYLYVLGYNTSIAVWVGLIALLGIAAEMGIFMLLYIDLAYQRKVKEGKMNSFADLEEAVKEGAVARIRPITMTTLTTFMALVPIMLASTASAGADVMKRMAAPMVGGIFSLFIIELLVFPCLYALWREIEMKRKGA
jgi:Cu(I)/Ag(I) efflux system membrane protein CusA/SilA